MSEYWDGPTYGIKDRQTAHPVAYCRRCGGEIYSHDEAEYNDGLCNACWERVHYKDTDLEGWPFEDGEEV